MLSVSLVVLFSTLSTVTSPIGEESEYEIEGSGSERGVSLFVCGYRLTKDCVNFSPVNGSTTGELDEFNTVK